MKPTFKEPAKPKPMTGGHPAAEGLASLREGLALHKKGQFAEAQELYQQTLNALPNHFDALHLLGLIAHQTKNPKHAEELIDRAIAINPNHAPAHNNLGAVLKELKRFDEALASFDQALKIKPDYAEAQNNRGNVLLELKRFDEALASYDQALQIRPDSIETQNNRGIVLKELKRFDEALDSYDQALRIRPNYAQAQNNRGNVLKELGRIDEALASYDLALKSKPDYSEAHFNRGIVLQDLKRLDEALASYDLALKLKPDYAEAHFNRGIVLQDLMQFDVALASYDQALKIKPDYAEAHNNRGIVLQDLRQFDVALVSYDQALKIKPDYAEAQNNCGNLLVELKRFDEALASYDLALKIKPDYAEAHNNRGNVLRKLKRNDEALASYDQALKIKPDYDFLYGTQLHTKMIVCDWSDTEIKCAELFQKIQHDNKAIPPFPLLALTSSLPLQRKSAELWLNEKYAKSLTLPPIPKRTRHRKIRIGYYSADYHNHATAYLMAGLFELHDKNRFELVAFSFGPDRNDEMRNRVSAPFDRFIDVRDKSDRNVALLSRDLGIDIAVDLKGYTEDHRVGIFSYGAAPLQVSYLGYPGTMGAKFIDYLIADGTLIPQVSQQHYSEKIVYLPNSYQVNDRKRTIAARKFSREELGLPSTGFVFCCFNNNYKITPTTFDGWMRILRRVESSVLWLLEGNPAVANNLRKEAEARGVGAERLVFAKYMPAAEHLARYREADLFIDTFPCNAHTTASDALWTGLPVLTCIGEAFASRVAASLLHAIDLPELITTTQEQYESLAVELATNLGRLQQIRQKLENNCLTTPLFDTQLFTKHIEDAYAQMYERYQADLPPDYFHVGQ